MSDYRSELLTALAQAKCEVVRRGKHDIYKNPKNNKTITVPRKVGNRHLANTVLKQAGINLKL